MTIQACQSWTESEEAAREFSESACEEDLREAVFYLWRASSRWSLISSATAKRLDAYADVLWDIGVRRFGPDCFTPF